MALVLGIGARLLGARLGRFLAGFTVIFFAQLCAAMRWAISPISRRLPDQLKKLGIPWSLNLTGEAGFIVALLAGLAVGNFLPRVADLPPRSRSPGMVHQDGHRAARGRSGSEERRGAGAGLGRHVPRAVRDR